SDTTAPAQAAVHQLPFERTSSSGHVPPCEPSTLAASTIHDSSIQNFRSQVAGSVSNRCLSDRSGDVWNSFLEASCTPCNVPQSAQSVARIQTDPMSSNAIHLPTNTSTAQTSPILNPTDGYFVALHDYMKRVDDDLSMVKGQTFRVLDQSHCDWWYVECSSTGHRGYVPKNHLAAVTSIESNEWYFGELRRVEAEHYLQMPGNEHGSFLVRLSESQANEYSLSVCLTYRFVAIEHSASRPPSASCKLSSVPSKPVHPEPIGLSHKLIDKWEIPKSSIVLKDQIGQGQFGEVYKAVWNKTTIVAVKTLKPSSCDAADFLREAQVMKQLHHPNLIQLYAVCTQSEPFYLVTEYMSKGSLLSYLQSSEGRTLSLQCLVIMASKIASGMAYLEFKRYIHRDLAARNVLVGEQHVVKIADFGLARMIHRRGKNREYVAHAGARFPIKWTAPEAANYSRFTSKSDVWSFGILLTEMVTYGRSPYPGMHNAEVLRQVEAGYRMSKPVGCPSELYDLMLDCWAADENKRPSFEKIQRRLEEYCEAEKPSYRGTVGQPHPLPFGSQPAS
ncbi:SH3 domain protein, partial [Opisthorchis viverrini]